ncbi:MAG: ECF transporter S component, partial [Acetanaerobacterium sp.]
MNTNTKRTPTRTLTILGILTAIEIIMAFTPLGSLPIGPIVATLAHIPVIIAGVTLGVYAGAYMGALFGLLSFIVNTMMPNLTSFIFTPLYSVGEVSGNALSLVICFVPRILLGVAAGLLFKLIATHDKRRYGAYLISAVAASLLHTVLVLGGVYLFFGADYASVIGQAYEVLLGLIFTVVLTNGIPEAILAAVCAVAVGKAL